MHNIRSGGGYAANIRKVRQFVPCRRRRRCRRSSDVTHNLCSFKGVAKRENVEQIDFSGEKLSTQRPILNFGLNRGSQKDNETRVAPQNDKQANHKFITHFPPEIISIRNLPVVEFSE